MYSYYSRISNALTRIFRNVGFTIVISKSNDLKDLLRKSKDKIEEKGKLDIFKVQWKIRFTNVT